MTRPSVVRLLPAALVLFACGDGSRGTQPSGPPAGSEVSFADSALTAAVVDALGAAQLPLTAAAARTLSQLTASDRGIEDLTGLDTLTALRTVDLSFNRIEDVTPLAGLPSLQALNLTANRVVDAAPLAGLPALEVLILDDNLVEEIGAFLKSPALRVLSLSGNPLSPGSLDRFEELASRGVEVEYLRGPPAEGDAGETFTPPPVPPQADWRILVQARVHPERGRSFLHSLGSGGGLTRIAGRGGLTLGEDTSPDGRWLAYDILVVEESRGRFDLLLLAPGEEAVRVTTDGADSITPAFSPDGRLLAYASGSTDDLDLFLYTIDDATSRLLVDDAGSASHPTWSPDGRRLAFSSYEGDDDAELYMLDVASGAVTRLTDNGAHDDAPDWSPDAGQLAFRSDRDGDLDVYILELASGQVRRLTDMAGHETEPHWSPDGERLVFSSLHGDGRYALHEIDVAGGEARPLTDDSLSTVALGWVGRLAPAFETGLEGSLFADDALAEAIRLAIGRAPSEPLSEDDLRGVLELRTLSPVSDLHGIDRLTSLSVLVLWFESLVDLTPLASLPVLRELYLRGGRLADLGPLASLSTLEVLMITGGEITDLAALSGMSLRRLAILDNPRLDLTTLGPVEVLWLTLLRCGIEDVSPLARLSSVSILDLSGNRISDVSPLLELSLQRLTLTGNPLSRESLDIHIPAMRAKGTLVTF